MKKIIKRIAIVIALITCCFPALYSQNIYRLVIDYQFDWISHFSEGLAAVQKGKKWGYIDNTGKLIIDYQFIGAGRFFEGLAVVKKDEKWGFIDKTGKLIIDYQLDVAAGFSEGLSRVKKGGKWGFIDKTGKLVIDYQFDDARRFSEGLAAVQKDEKWGFIDKMGKLVIDYQFNGADYFSEGLANVKKYGKWGYIDKTRKLVIDYLFDEAGFFSEGLANVKKHEKWGYIDKTGKLIIDYQFYVVEYFSEGLAYVRKGGKFGYIDKTGKLVIDYQFYGVDYFSEGLAAVQKGGKWGFIARYTLIDRIKEYVEAGILQWQKKGEFEKTADYTLRVNEKTRNAKVEELTAQSIALLKKKYMQTILSEGLELKDYDADNEVYLISSKSLRDFTIPVPIADAPSFKQNFAKAKFEDYDFSISDNAFQLARLTVNNPANSKKYRYDSKEPVTYAANNIIYNFSPIEVDIPKEKQKTQTAQVKSNTITVGLADVDVNIPSTTKINNNFFAVIIANENYRREAPVPFAINDGRIFREYCVNTLGIPKAQIHLIENATLNDLRHEISWISSVMKTQKGEANIIFYYAGHGIPNEATKKAYLLPTDGFSADFTTGYALEDIYVQLGKLPAQSITYFIDACFSGAKREEGMLASARGVSIKVKESSLIGNTVAFTAASDEQTAYPYYEKGHGLFTYFLLKKLQETKGEVTYEELANYISDKVSKTSVIVNSKLQSPTMKANSILQDKWKNWMLK